MRRHVRSCGEHYSKMQREVWKAEDLVSKAPSTEAKIKQVAKMAAVAIPLHYVTGRQHEHSLKYCVITNWWRERMQNGLYELPSLDFDLYQ